MGHYDIVNYTTDNGLPQNAITGIQFDRKGYCWLGTQMGLARFDGQRFRFFNSDNIKGLRSDRIFNITSDTAGNLYIGTGDALNVVTVKDSSSTAASLPFLYPGPGPAIPIRGFVTPGIQAQSFKASPYSELLGTARGGIYLIDEKTSYYITAAGKLPINFRGPYQGYRLLLIGENLLTLEPHNKVTIWLKDKQQPSALLRGPLWSDPNFIKGNFVIPSNTDGAYIYTGNTLYHLSLQHNILYSEIVLDGINVPAMSCLYIDKKNNRYFFGSSSSGLFVITPTGFYSPPMPNAANKDVYDQALMEDGIISQQFLFRRDNTYKSYPLLPQQRATWYQAANHSLYYAPDLALLRFDTRTGKTYSLFPISVPLSAIFPDPLHKDRLVFSTDFTIGKLSQDTLIEEKKLPGLAPGQDLLAPYPVGTDTFLLATAAGLKWYDYQRNKIYRSILDSLVIRQLYIESPQRIWIASYGKGWYLYDKGRIIRMPDGPLDALKTVNAIIDDGRGYFWLSSNNGLFKVSKKALAGFSEKRSEEVYFYAFTTKDHLPTNEFNSCNPSYLWLADSMLSLTTIKGLVWFYPHKMHLTLPDKGIYIEHIRINQTAIQLVDGKLLLDADHGRLNLNVSSPYFGNKVNIRLKFKIEGLDEEWNPVPEDGNIIIDRLPAGTFSLVVSKITGMEPGQCNSIKLPIEVRPYWYNTRLFYLALLFFVFISVYLLVKLRTRLLQTRNRKLKIQVAMRTRDLNRMVYQLTQSEDDLKKSNQTKDNIITTVLHDLRSPIRFMYTISKHVASGYQQMQQNTLGAHLQELKNSMASLNSFTDQFFTWALSQHGTFSAKNSYEDLAELFRETETLYADIMNAKGNRLIVTPTDIYCLTDPQLLSTVVRNLLDNANKYTSRGEIKLSAVRSGDQVIITVSDTGSGFSPEALAAFLNKDKTDPRSGRGSFIILYLLELIDGRLEADSAPSKGTTFRIVLHHNKTGSDK